MVLYLLKLSDNSTSIFKHYGPLPEGRSRVYYIFMVVDCSSKFVRLLSLQKAQAKTSAIKINPVIPVKVVVLFDHGTQCPSQIRQNTLKQDGITPTLISVRNPASNPAVRMIKEIGWFLRSYCHDSHRGRASKLKHI